MKNKAKSITLIELIIVVMLVGVLVGVTIPMITGRLAKAKKLEAVAALRAIRTAERIYRAKTSHYWNLANTGWTDIGDLSPYIKAGDLSGRYFPESCYEVSGASTNTFTATCIPAYSGKRSSNTLGNISIDQDDVISGY